MILRTILALIVIGLWILVYFAKKKKYIQITALFLTVYTIASLFFDKLNGLTVSVIIIVLISIYLILNQIYQQKLSLTRLIRYIAIKEATQKNLHQ